ncbi:MAG: alpha/beta hydrolase [Acidobacteriota bacterium]
MRETIYFATNRNPTGVASAPFGIHFNPVHPHELRFGEIQVDLGPREHRLTGPKLAQRLARKILKEQAVASMYPEQLEHKPYRFGSKTLFSNLKAVMDQGRDCLVYIHGYNVSFTDAVGAAAALQHKLRQQPIPVQVVLFTWPSDGRKLPFRSYKRDRDDAAAAGLAFSRGFRKLHDFLRGVKRRDSCARDIHLLCHSMGNFALQKTLSHLAECVPGTLPRLFAEIILAAADVDDDALEHEEKLARLPEIGRRINIYYNRGDRALEVADRTKGNPDRLGESGPRHPLDTRSGVVNIDTTEIVHSLVEHAYYLDEALEDLSQVVSGIREDRIPGREYVPSANSYRLVG